MCIINYINHIIKIIETMKRCWLPPFVCILVKYVEFNSTDCFNVILYDGPISYFVTSCYSFNWEFKTLFKDRELSFLYWKFHLWWLKYLMFTLHSEKLLIDISIIWSIVYSYANKKIRLKDMIKLFYDI